MIAVNTVFMRERGIFSISRIRFSCIVIEEFIVSSFSTRRTIFSFCRYMASASFSRRSILCVLLFALSSIRVTRSERNDVSSLPLFFCSVKITPFFIFYKGIDLRRCLILFFNFLKIRKIGFPVLSGGLQHNNSRHYRCKRYCALSAKRVLTVWALFLYCKGKKSAYTRFSVQTDFFSSHKYNTMCLSVKQKCLLARAFLESRQ